MSREHWDSTHVQYRDWLLSRGYIWTREGAIANLGIAWSTRIGYDFTDLEFWPWVNHAGVPCVDAIVGHHASGSNPRLGIGTCESLAEVQEIHDLLRRLNGYKVPEPERSPSSGASTP